MVTLKACTPFSQFTYLISGDSTFITFFWLPGKVDKVTDPMLEAFVTEWMKPAPGFRVPPWVLFVRLHAAT